MTDEAPLLQGCSRKGHNRLPGQQEGGWAPRPCPECLKLFEPNVHNQLFCTPAHNTAWNNRSTARGRALTPLSMVASITRNGTRGTPDAREAGRAACRAHHALIQKHRDEDRAAGRMEWPEYLNRRFAIGYDPLT